MRRPRVAAVLALLAATPAARGNGRFPTGGYLVAAPGPAGDHVVVRSTFGLLSTHDGGRTWGWTCEDATSSSGMFDASIAIAVDGRVLATTPRGLVATTDGCAWTAPAGSPVSPLVDISQDATRRHLVTALGPTGTDDALLRSDDGGAHWTLAASLPGLYTQTVEVAPSDPQVVYVSGFLGDGTPVLLRSDDGGASVREIARGDAFLGGTSAFISGVDPTDPAVLYVRAADGLGTLLLRSGDHGATFTRLARTAGVMAGFALSDDGATVWIGSNDRSEGILRSRAGEAFARTGASLSVRCLRQLRGTLYVCADQASDGFLVGCSLDGGDHVDPMLTAASLTGPPAECASSTPVASVCGPQWPAQRDALRALDAGALDAAACFDVGPTDAPGSDTGDATARDAAAMVADLGAQRDAVGSSDIARSSGDAAFDAATPGAPVPPRSCGCAVPGGASRGASAALLAVLLARRRRRVL